MNHEAISIELLKLDLSTELGMGQVEPSINRLLKLDKKLSDDFVAQLTSWKKELAKAKKKAKKRPEDEALYLKLKRRIRTMLIDQVEQLEIYLKPGAANDLSWQPRSKKSTHLFASIANSPKLISQKAIKSAQKLWSIDPLGHWIIELQEEGDTERLNVELRSDQTISGTTKLNTGLWVGVSFRVISVLRLPIGMRIPEITLKVKGNWKLDQDKGTLELALNLDQGTRNLLVVFSVKGMQRGWLKGKVLGEEKMKIRMIRKERVIGGRMSSP